MHMTIMRGAQLLCIIILNKTNDVQKSQYRQTERPAHKNV